MRLPVGAANHIFFFLASASLKWLGNTVLVSTSIFANVSCNMATTFLKTYLPKVVPVQSQTRNCGSY